MPLYENFLIFKIKNKQELVKIIYFYRYISLVITSLFYFFTNTIHALGIKFFVISCITISAIILNYLYVKFYNNKRKVMLLLLLETICNILILIPSGGLNSPYVWYFLNTILISTIVLNNYLCWINIIVYVLSSIAGMFFLNNPKQDIMYIINSELNIVLSFVLITLLIQSIIYYAKKNEENNLQLRKSYDKIYDANRLIKENLSYTKEIYNCLHLLTTDKEKKSLIYLIMNYCEKITKEKIIFFLSIDNNENFYIESINSNNKTLEYIHTNIKPMWNAIIKNEKAKEYTLLKNRIFLTTIKCRCKVEGVLGIIHKEKKCSTNNILSDLNFLSELGAIVFDKVTIENTNEQLLINAEQNERAKAIHAGIVQKLFSISCSIFGILKNINIKNKNVMEQELNMIRSSINSTMHDLRNTIYELSWDRHGDKHFILITEKYIQEVSLDNNVRIKFNTTGNSETMSTLEKKAVYKIICEGISNAVKHGRSMDISISLSIAKNQISLDLYDNGIGFDINQVKLGLGINNMKVLTNNLNGHISFEKNKDSGTKINVIIPKNTKSVPYKEKLYENTSS